MEKIGERFSQEIDSELMLIVDRFVSPRSYLSGDLSEIDRFGEILLPTGGDERDRRTEIGSREGTARLNSSTGRSFAAR